MFQKSKSELLAGAESVEAFLARKGQIQQVEEGVSNAKDPALRYCRCGCHGDYSQHSMRAGESGRSSSVVIR